MYRPYFTMHLPPPPERARCRAGQTCRLKNQGFAIGLILAAVALLATLSLTFLASTKSNIGWGHVPHADTEASAIIAQGRNLRSGIDVMTAAGTTISSITFDTAATTGLFNPQTGGTEPQQPLLDALTNASSAWVWKVDGSGNPVVKLYNVGVAANSDYVVVLPYLKPDVCKAINNLLYGVTTVNTLASVTTAALTTPATALDLSASSSGTQGRPEGCFNTSNGDAFYLVTLRPQ